WMKCGLFSRKSIWWCSYPDKMSNYLKKYVIKTFCEFILQFNGLRMDMMRWDSSF
uniref:Uncharacterized protein n=1 Tax=Trichobilharzia regenti TaxID=157069 RepID=A0AA85J3X3_TRIRE